MFCPPPEPRKAVALLRCIPRRGYAHLRGCEPLVLALPPPLPAPPRPPKGWRPPTSAVSASSWTSRRSASSACWRAPSPASTCSAPRTASWASPPNVYQGSVFPYYAAMDERIRDRNPGDAGQLGLPSTSRAWSPCSPTWSSSGRGRRNRSQRWRRRGSPSSGSSSSASRTSIPGDHRPRRASPARGSAPPSCWPSPTRSWEMVRRKIAPAEGEEPPALPRVYFMWAQGPLQTGRPQTAPCRS